MTWFSHKENLLFLINIYLILLRFILNPLHLAFIMKNEFSPLQRPNAIFTWINNFTTRYCLFLAIVVLNYYCSHLTSSEFLFTSSLFLEQFYLIVLCMQVQYLAVPWTLFLWICWGGAEHTQSKASASGSQRA